MRALNLCKIATFKDTKDIIRYQKETNVSISDDHTFPAVWKQEDRDIEAQVLDRCKSVWE